MIRVGSTTGIATSSNKLPEASGPMTKSFLAVVLELGQLDRVLPCMDDGFVTDPVLAGRVRNLHPVKFKLTLDSRQDVLDGVLLQDPLLSAADARQQEPARTGCIRAARVCPSRSLCCRCAQQTSANGRLHSDSAPSLCVRRGLQFPAVASTSSTNAARCGPQSLVLPCSTCSTNASGPGNTRPS
jgi:hypothetical protein